MTAVEVSHLTKRFGDLAAVDDASFQVPDGQLLAVLGPNGAGKTTTLEILEGFAAPTGGTVRVLGADPHRAGRAWRARIGLVLQSTSLDASLTVRGTLSVFAQLYPRPRSVDEVLELVDLTDEAGTKVGVLSGGQRRRVDVGIGVIGRPDILFLDEPTTGLDPEARRRAWAGVQNLTDTTPAQLRSQGGLTTIRYRIGDRALAAGLPETLAPHLDADRRTLVIRSPDVTAALRDLVAWADRHHINLAGLEVGPPSLEEAYLAATGEPLSPELHQERNPQ
jgi:ABC-2 type transport system ATP-binding protein